MRWLWILLIPSICWGLAPIANVYEDKNEIYREFRNFTDNAQAKIIVVPSTPNAIDMNDNDLWVYQSSANAKDVFLFLKIGTTVYGSINFPVIKVR